MSVGAWSEFAMTTEDFIALKPAGHSMTDAASIPLAAMTALQALRHSGCDIKGKTVFVPAGCESQSHILRDRSVNVMLTLQ